MKDIYFSKKIKHFYALVTTTTHNCAVFTDARLIHTKTQMKNANKSHKSDVYIGLCISPTFSMYTKL